MPNAVRSLAVVASLLIAACGGKIADDPNAVRDGRDGTGTGGGSNSGSSGGFSRPEPPPAPTITDPSPPPAPTSGTKPSVEDACATICERDGKCGAWQTDCIEHCTDQLYGASSCAPQASAYIHCYADNLEPGCAALPPVCESAYCAYTQCAGKVVPNYCH